MSRAADTSGGAASGIKTIGGIVFVVVMALAVLYIVSAQPGPEPFDPRSGRASGARGLVLTLQDSGGRVADTKTVPDPFDDTRVLLLEDRLDDQQRAALLDFVDAGGIAVVADPESTLHGGSGLDGGAVPVSGSTGSGNQQSAEREANVASGDCTIAALERLRGIFVPSGVLFPVGPDEPQCMTSAASASGGYSFVIVREIGDGLIIGLGDNHPFVNENLRFADNAGLAVALLVPARDARVTFLLGRGASPTIDDIGTGEETLRDLIPNWVWMALVVGAVAFVVFAISRAIGFGRIVAEPIAAPIAGSELVSATGNLMERAGHAPRAGWLLLERLHRDLCRAHDVDLAAPLGDLDRVVAHGSTTQLGEVESILRRTVVDDSGLVELTAAIDRLRLRVFPDARRADRDPSNVELPETHQSEHHQSENQQSENQQDESVHVS